MTNTLVGEVYARIIEEVVAASSNDFEESGVGSTTLQELQQEWQAKLSERKVAQMPWDPKPAPPQQQTPSNVPIQTPTSATGIPPPSSYPPYEASQASNTHSNPQIKTESNGDGLPNGAANGGYPPNGLPTQGGNARAQQLMQQQFGNAATASINAMQQRGGLALPGQQPKPQGLQLPPQGLTPQQQQYAAQQQHAALQLHRQQQQHQHMQLMQNQARIKVENDSPQVSQASPDQKAAPNPAYSQTDGADEALEEWRSMLAQRRAASAREVQSADRMMHDQIMQLSKQLSNGLLLPADNGRAKSKKRRVVPNPSNMPSTTASPLPAIVEIPQLDGDADDDEKAEAKDDEDDENAINSDLDDPDDDGQGPMGDDDEELGDQILCTYDKVQRVKNKWKCTLKDGVMTVKGREWVFHKGMGEFEW